MDGKIALSVMIPFHYIQTMSLLYIMFSFEIPSNFFNFFLNYFNILAFNESYFCFCLITAAFIKISNDMLKNH